MHRHRSLSSLCLWSVSASLSASLGAGSAGPGLTRLPHLLEQAIEGATVLLRALLKMVQDPRPPPAVDPPAPQWDRKPIAEAILIR